MEARSHKCEYLRLIHPPPSSIPPGWSYNPSAWGHRIWEISFAAIAVAIVGYSAAYRFHWTDWAWEPWWGSSELYSAESAPMLDPAIGAVGYLMALSLTLIGGKDRWRNHPWIVGSLALLLTVLAALNLIVAVMQPNLRQEWSALWVALALVSVVSVGPALDEWIAAFQFMRNQRGKRQAL